MWIPRRWEDLELAIGVQAEGQTLDFKSALPPGRALRDLAKDTAAMSLEGGVILVGMDEQDGLATQLTPIDLRGAVERVRQVIDARVTPPLGVEMEAVRANVADREGALVIAVPPSWSAPHQYDGRFPARSGSTTRFLSEREVEALYERRAQLRAASQASGGLAGFSWPPGVDLQVDASVGLLRMHVRPPGRTTHPDEPHLGNSLDAAVRDVAASDEGYIAGAFAPKALDLLRQWQPAGTRGWRAGEFTGDEKVIAGTGAVGGMYTYGGGFSFAITISLTDGIEPDVVRTDTTKTAQEHHWAIETLSLLRIAGRFYSAVPEASILRVDMELGGLLDAVSWQSSQGTAFSSNAPRVTENLYRAGGLYSAHELAADPRRAVRELLDPFMVAILEPGSDIVALIAARE